ncbi:MAG: hypothetical protein WA421_15715 [Nitrososphaeraceae archaeon]
MTPSHTNYSAPTVSDDNSIRFSSCIFNTKAYGLIHSANDLVTIWKRLVKSGFPLEEISSLLKIADEPIEIIRTIDALECCRSIKGIKRRSTDLRKNYQPLSLRRILQQKRKSKKFCKL